MESFDVFFLSGRISETVRDRALVAIDC